MISESLQLRMISITFCFPLQDLLCQERFAPQCDETYPIEVLRMYAPQSHRFSRQMETFSTVAKLTHKRYGTSSTPAVFDILKK